MSIALYKIELDKNAKDFFNSPDPAYERVYPDWKKHISTTGKGYLDTGLSYAFITNKLKEYGIITNDIIPEVTNNGIVISIEKYGAAVNMIRNNQTNPYYMVAPLGIYNVASEYLFEFGFSTFMLESFRLNPKTYLPQIMEMSVNDIFESYQSYCTYPNMILARHLDALTRNWSYYGNKFDSGHICWGSTTTGKNLITYYTSLFNNHLTSLMSNFGFNKLTTTGYSIVIQPDEVTLKYPDEEENKKETFTNKQLLEKTNEPLSETFNLKKLTSIFEDAVELDDRTPTKIIKFCKDWDPIIRYLIAGQLAFRKSRVPGSTEISTFHTGIF